MDHNSASWQLEVDQLEHRRQLAREMGGPDGVARQHRQGKLTARERIDRFFDPGTFQEVGALAGKATYDESGYELKEFTPSNIVIGKGRVDGRRTVVAADDYTIRGGSSEATSPEKWQYAEQAALRDRQPLVRFVDMAGGSVRLLEQMKATKLPAYPMWEWVRMLEEIPVATVACGPCAGLGAQKVAASHFSVQVAGVGQVFAAGPAVVEPGIREVVDKEVLGGVEVHAKGSGVVDNAADDEDDAIAQIRRWLSYMPANVWSLPSRQLSGDDPERREDELLDIIPRNQRRVYDSRRMLELILDRGSIFEIGRYHGRGAIAALGRLNGYAVGILSSDPRHYGGAQGEREAEKFTRFIDVCDTFHLPIINFHDQPGTMVGTEAEARGTVGKTMRTLVAIEQSTVPWCAVMVRRAYGLAGSGWGRWAGVTRVAWPSAHWGSIPIEGGVFAAYRRDIEASPDPAARTAELEERYRAFASPFRTAERFGVDDILDSRDTRSFLCQWVEDAYGLTPGARDQTARVPAVTVASGPSASVRRSIFEGVRVIEASTVIAAPLSAALLADFGAEVIKIEDPIGGDPVRRLGPMWRGQATSSKVTNRNKRSVTLKLSSDAGRKVFLGLVENADVVVTNFRPPTLRRWDLDYDDLVAVRPDLVMLHLTGFGRTGPYQDRPGFARVGEAFAGLTHITGMPDGPPMFAGYAVGDGLAGVYGAFALSAALVHRERTGEGQLIDLALYEPTLRILESLVVDYDLLGIVPGRTGNQNPAVAPSSIYKTADGHWVTVPASTQQMFERLCRALGEPELVDDHCYVDNRTRIEHRQELDQRIEELVGRLRYDELSGAFEAEGVAHGPILTAEEIVHDEHIAARENLVRAPDPRNHRGVLMQAPVPTFSRTPGAVRAAGPEAGDHTDEVLSELCGLGADEIARLRSEGVV